MTKLCPRGKAAAKRKFKVYPSAYANAYASKICAGKIKDPSGVKRKDFKGRKPAFIGGLMKKKDDPKTKEATQKRKLGERIKRSEDAKKEVLEKMKKELGLKAGGRIGYSEGTPKFIKEMQRMKVELGLGKFDDKGNFQAIKPDTGRNFRKPKMKTEAPKPQKRIVSRSSRMGGGLMEATQRLRRQGLKAGGRGCKLAMKGRGRAYGKNS